MSVDLKYCCSSFLTIRTIYDDSKCFSNEYPPLLIPINKDRNPVADSFELEAILKKYTEEAFKNHKVALCLSGGIDSAILARFVPKDPPATRLNALFQVWKLLTKFLKRLFTQRNAD